MNGRGGDARRLRLAVKVGANVRQRREWAGMDRRALAKRVGLQEKALYRLEKGLSCPRLDTLDEIAEALQTTVERLVKGCSDKKTVTLTRVSARAAKTSASAA